MNNKNIKLKEKICYGFGTFGYTLESSFVILYFTLFATDVMGLKTSIVGLIILIPKLIDIISDIIIMNKVDKTNTRFGTYKPWLITAIPIGIFLILLFLDPSFLTNDITKIIWIISIYTILISVFETLYWCSFGSVTNVMSKKKDDWTSLTSFRTAFENLGNIIVAGISMPLITHFGSYRDAIGWRYTALLFAILGIINMLICIIGIKEKHKLEKQNYNLLYKLKILLKNKKYVKVIILMMLLIIPMYNYYTLLSYFCIHNLGHNEWIATLSIFSTITSIITSFIITRLNNKIGKKKSLLIGTILIFISSIIFIYTNSYRIMVIFIIIKSIGQTISYVTLFTYSPEVAYEIKENNNIDMPGIVFSSLSSVQKLSAALGAYMATVILSLGKYNVILNEQTMFTKNSIRYGISISYFVCLMITVVILNKNKINMLIDKIKEG